MSERLRSLLVASSWLLGAGSLGYALYSKSHFALNPTLLGFLVASTICCGVAARLTPCFQNKMRQALHKNMRNFDSFDCNSTTETLNIELKDLGGFCNGNFYLKLTFEKRKEETRSSSPVYLTRSQIVEETFNGNCAVEDVVRTREGSALSRLDKALARKFLKIRNNVVKSVP